MNWIKHLTEFDIKVYEAIYQYLEENGPTGPTIREITRILGTNSTSQIKKSVKKLQIVHLVDHTKEVSRGIRLVGERYELPPKKHLTPTVIPTCGHIYHIHSSDDGTHYCELCEYIATLAT